MPRSHFARLTHASSAIFLSGLLFSAQAVELGEPVVRSYIGQPLVADIELTALAGDAPSVQVRLASPEVYRGANIGMNPVLSSLTMSVMRRDGRQFLHITSIRPLEADYVHLFLELTEASQSAVRGATLWLSRDPNPAPPPRSPAPPPAPYEAPEAPPARAELHSAAAAPSPRPAPAPIPAAPLRPAQGTKPAACPQPYSAQQIQTCAIIDYKNALLTAQIIELEEKVKVLQSAIAGKPMAPARAAASAASASVKAGAARKKNGGMPWLWIGIAAATVFVVVGALVYLMRRKTGKGGRAKRTNRNPVPPADPAAPPRPSFITSVKNRLMPARAAAEPAPVEPQLE